MNIELNVGQTWKSSNGAIITIESIVLNQWLGYRQVTASGVDKNGNALTGQLFSEHDIRDYCTLQ